MSISPYVQHSCPRVPRAYIWVECSPCPNIFTPHMYTPLLPECPHPMWRLYVTSKAHDTASASKAWLQAFPVHHLLSKYLHKKCRAWLDNVPCSPHPHLIPYVDLMLRGTEKTTLKFKETTQPRHTSDTLELLKLKTILYETKSKTAAATHSAEMASSTRLDPKCEFLMFVSKQTGWNLHKFSQYICLYCLTTW